MFALAGWGEVRPATAPSRTAFEQNQQMLRKVRQRRLDGICRGRFNEAAASMLRKVMERGLVKLDEGKLQ